LYSFLFLSTISFAQNSNSQEQDASLRDGKDSVVVSISSEMLDEDTYWGIIENSLKDNSTPADQELFF
jgi:hypothetical protein